ERIPYERLQRGNRVKALIIEVRGDTMGPQIVVPRSHPDLVRPLLELEVPELADGTVEIVAIAREPGHRTKIAVVSHDPNVDAKGAAVGARGSRVRQVVNELRGEKVDVVQWRENTAEFIAEALGPARVREVQIDEEEKTATVIVSDHQLSLAIGKEGQNARLAARLSGYKVDIRSDRPEEEAAEGEGEVSAMVAEPGEAAAEAPAPAEAGDAEATEVIMDDAVGQQPVTAEQAIGGEVDEESITAEAGIGEDDANTDAADEAVAGEATEEEAQEAVASGEEEQAEERAAEAAGEEE